MAERTRGMGRGLAAILSTSPSDAEAELRELPVELIAPNPQQPRRNFEEGSLVALSESLKERGILQPVLVRPVPGGTYELIAGERRWRAAQLAGLETVPAMVRPHDDAESLELALIENMAREDLNALEAARAVAALVEELGLTREEVGRRVGRSRVAVSNLLRLLELPDEALALIADGVLSEGHGRALLMAPDHDSRRRLARDAGTHGWSVRQTEGRARAAAGREDGEIAVSRIAPSPHPDQMDAAERLGEAFGRALGTDVRVTPKAKGYRIQFAFDSLDEALEAAERLGLTATA
ncbi:MAG TPA: ParB/RepB/Spo0J family partition protein [Solirubrobacteraceae bacterium]|nr:ParB/RepB/Spo0J family partition protein [Solirubrobacteraceae bacterium]